jgi:hypothetical protein
MESIGITANSWLKGQIWFLRDININGKIKISGLPYTVKIVDNRDEIYHDDNEEENDDENDSDSQGKINHFHQSIRILKSSPERELRLLLYKILRGIVTKYYIRELMDTNYNPIEAPIYQLSLGLAEVLESVENVSIASNID